MSELDVFAALTTVTVVSGAFMAGNEAGIAYPEWPLMNGAQSTQDALNPNSPPPPNPQAK